MIDRKDIDRLVAAKTYTTNPEWPAYNSNGIKYKLYADGFSEVWMIKTNIALTETPTAYGWTFPTEVFNGNQADNVQLAIWYVTNDERCAYAKVIGRPANGITVKLWISSGTENIGILSVYASGIRKA